MRVEFFLDPLLDFFLELLLNSAAVWTLGIVTDRLFAGELMKVLFVHFTSTRFMQTLPHLREKEIHF